MSQGDPRAAANAKGAGDEVEQQLIMLRRAMDLAMGALSQDERQSQEGAENGLEMADEVIFKL